MPHALKRVGSAVRSQPSSRWIGLAVAVVVAIGLISRNAWLFHVPVLEDGDDAANSILIDKSMAGEWFLGHYSRLGFYHPGPFFLYVLGVGEFLFYNVFHLTPTPFNGHLLAAMILNAAVIGICTSVVGARLKNPLASLWTAALLLTLVLLDPSPLVTAWHPHMVVLPFALLLIATASTISGRTDHLPIAVLALGILVHGHASFVVICGILFLFVGVFIGVQIRRKKIAFERRTLIISAAVAALFLLPIVLNTLLHWPGEIPLYISSPNKPALQTRTLWDVASYMGQFWHTTSPLMAVFALLVVVGAVVAVFLAKQPLRGFLAMLLVLCALATVITFGYVWKGVDNLELTYLAEFYYVVPLLVLLIAVLGFTSLLDRWRWVAIAVALLGGVVVMWIIVASPHAQSGYRGISQASRVEQLINERVPGDSEVVMEFDTQSWPIAAGIVEQLRRDGRAVCVDAGSQFRTTFTESLMCTKAEIANGTKVKITNGSNGKVPAGAILIDSGYYLTFPR